MAMNIAHQPTPLGPEASNGSVRPRPTSLSDFSGISAVPVHNQTRIAATPVRPEAIAIQYQWKVAKMKAPPMRNAAIIGRRLGVDTRRHWIGLASIEV